MQVSEGVLPKSRYSRGNCGPHSNHRPQPMILLERGGQDGQNGMLKAVVEGMVKLLMIRRRRVCGKERGKLPIYT